MDGARRRPAVSAGSGSRLSPTRSHDCHRDLRPWNVRARCAAAAAIATARGRIYWSAPSMLSGPEPRFGVVPTGALIDVATLAVLLDHAYDAVAVRRPTGEILYWNKGAERTFGWTAAEAAGQVSHVLLQTRFSTPLASIEEALAESGVWEGQLVHTRRDGQEVIADSRWALDAAGREGVVLEINRDVTAPLAAEASARRRERQLRFVADSAPVLIAHCDLDHRFKFVNRPYAARFGLEPADLIGRRIPEILGPGAFEAIKA